MKKIKPQAASASPPDSRGLKPVAAWLICIVLLIQFAVLAWLGVRDRSATGDEPMHALGAYLVTRHGDYRINPEDPNLWQRWAALGQFNSLNVKRSLEEMPVAAGERRAGWADLLKDQRLRFWWASQVLYRTPGNDADGFLMGYRIMLIGLAVALGALVCRWGWRVGRATGGTVATALYCLDPNFIGHAAMIKNDIAMSLVALWISYAVWNAGRGLNWLSGVAVVLSLALAPCTKFTGIVFAMIGAGLLLFRAWTGGDWVVFGRNLTRRGQRCLFAGVVVIVAGCASYLGIWASYGFAFSPTATGELFDRTEVLNSLARNESLARHGGEVGVHSEEELGSLVERETKQWKPHGVAAALLWVEDRRLLPQAWVHGLLYTYANSRARPSYLCGEYSMTGWRSYFPLAIAFKTPLSTIVAICGSIGLLTWIRMRRSGSFAQAGGGPDGWTLGCLLIPVLLYGWSAVTSSMNIGIRHILPLYPPVFVLVGWAGARLVGFPNRSGQAVVGGLMLLLGIETWLAFPNYLAHFNVAAGGSRGGISLLGDSNLDWGQDLPALARWQRENGNVPVYLCYFGTADPNYYGVRYAPLRLPTADGIVHGDEYPATKATGLPPLPARGSMVAISATHLQGIYQPRAGKKLFRLIREQLVPVAVLGGSIYIYEWPELELSGASSGGRAASR